MHFLFLTAVKLFVFHMLIKTMFINIIPDSLFNIIVTLILALAKAECIFHSILNCNNNSVFAVCGCFSYCIYNKIWYALYLIIYFPSIICWKTPLGANIEVSSFSPCCYA